MKLCLIAAQSDYNTRRAGITSAIVIAILIPVGICLFCVLIHLRQRAQEKAYNKGYGDNRNANTFERNNDTVENNSIVFKPAPSKEVQEVTGENGEESGSTTNNGPNSSMSANPTTTMESGNT